MNSTSSHRTAKAITSAGDARGVANGGKISVAFLIRSLESGGAEAQVARIAAGLDKDRFDVTVLCFYRRGSWVQFLESAGVEVVSLEKKGRWDLPAFSFRLIRSLRALDPHVLHSFLGPPNIFATVVKPLLRKPQVVWSIRASNVDFKEYDWTWGTTFRFERMLSRFPDLIIANSQAGKHHCLKNGFCDARMTVIPNGIDTEEFRPDSAAGRALRAQWGVAEDGKLVGLVARLDPMKDHANFLQAAAILAAENQDVRFVCIGGEGRQDRAQLRALAASLGISDRVIWAGHIGKVPSALSALDVHVSASAYGEGFSNAIGEAMAVGVPCVVTDVGDSALIVENLGVVVPARDSQALAEGWRRMLALNEHDFRALSEKCRRRIEDEYSLSSMLERLSVLYQNPRWAGAAG